MEKRYTGRKNTELYPTFKNPAPKGGMTLRKRRTKKRKGGGRVLGKAKRIESQGIRGRGLGHSPTPIKAMDRK